MNEEELFCKLFPEYVVNGKPLSPYFDLFESGFEQSENCIEELEKENTKLNEHIENIYANHCGNCNRNILNTSLKKENAELENKIRFMGKQFDNLKAITKYDRFAKAKEIIKKMLYEYQQLCLIKKETIAEAEQFLKETE